MDQILDQIIIETPRLLLKSITPQILHKIFESMDREEIMRYFGFDDAGFNHHLAMHKGGMETHRYSLYYFLLLENQSRLTIGECGFHSWNRPHNRAEVFYNMRSDDHKNKGFMTEAMAQVLKFGFTKLNLHRIQALVAAENEPSLKLLKRYGFKFEGVMREDYQVDGIQEDSVSYSLLKWEWEKMPHIAMDTTSK